MGREIKRIALDFDYPINAMIWKGYHNPYRGLKCTVCDGTGMSPEFKKLSDDWYDFADSGRKWNHNITQDEVQALVDAGRLWDFTRVPRNDEQREVVKKKIAGGENSWLPFDNGYIPTAEEINDWSRKGFGHDSCNHWICVKARAKRFGITQIDCSVCNGHGELWPDEKYRQLCEDFEDIQPPDGDGYQLWTTTTEGTPMSPVFETPEELAKWLSETGESSFGSDTASYDQWLAFIKGPGWSLSMIKADRGLESGVAYAARTASEEA